MHAAGWTIVIPVKRLSAGKTRLRAAGPTSDDLVLAIAIDTIDAVLAAEAVRRVLVVSDDPLVTSAARDLGAVTLADPGTNLNGAIAHGATHAGAAEPRAALLADLPALRPHELTAALRAVETIGRRAFVKDHAGSGTTLLAAPPAVPLDPLFGPGSAAAHAASGAAALRGGWPGLRQDVDTHADLAAAIAHGVGRRTTHAIAAGFGTVSGMQATIATFDAERRTATALRDDGSEIFIPAGAFDASGLRLLRLGQRVRIERDEGDHVVRIALVTM